MTDATGTRAARVFETGWKPSDKRWGSAHHARLHVAAKPMVTSNESGGARAR